MVKKDKNEKTAKQYYKTRISELEKDVQIKDRTIYDLRCRLKYLERLQRQPKKRFIPKKNLTAKEKALEALKLIRKKREEK